MAKQNKTRKGFTLVELIIVIAVIAILAAIAVPQFAGYIERGNKSNDDALAALIEKSIMLLIADETIIPTDDGGEIVVTNGASSGLAYDITDCDLSNKGGTAYSSTLTLESVLNPLVGTSGTMKYYDHITVTIAVDPNITSATKAYTVTALGDVNAPSGGGA